MRRASAMPAPAPAVSQQVTTLANGTWAPAQEIASPTDSDIAFGTPALRRGDALHDQTNFAEHVAALDAGRSSSLGFTIDVDAR